MTDAGWIRRNTIIWYKRNCMPSSAKDRFTIDFEYLYFFTKSDKYWFEQQTEPLAESTSTDHRIKNEEFVDRRPERNYPGGQQLGGGMLKPYGDRRNKRCVWDIPTRPFPGAHFAVFPEALIETPILSGCPPNGIVLDPFLGSGTSARVAIKTGRRFIGFEANPEYKAMADKSIDPLLMQTKLDI